MKKIAWLVLLAMLLSCLAACGAPKTELEKSFVTVPVSGGLKIVTYTGNYTTLEIPATIGGKDVVAIGDEVFTSSILLTDVIIPDTVREIGNRTFQGCLALERIVIPDSVKSIGDYAFFGCWAAKTLEIGSGLEKIGRQAFQYCKSLESISVAKENKKFASSDDGVLYTADYKTLICFPASSAMTSYTVPDNCHTLEDYSFRNCVNLETLNIGESVTELGEGTFTSCTALKTVDLKAKIEHIGYKTFIGCTALEEIVIPEGVKTIGYLLEDGECGSSFDGCTSLRRVVFPVSLTNIYKNSFNGCGALAVIDYCGGEAEWKNVIIGQGNAPLTTAKINMDYTAE
ncbi:MAG: leucine-rich repeat domain-containing protein [Clostridia bacterium]|nr:leucine-rich repeat domain-containing protein [Clostridia bacterium]